MPITRDFHGKLVLGYLANEAINLRDVTTWIKRRFLWIKQGKTPFPIPSWWTTVVRPIGLITLLGNRSA